MQGCCVETDTVGNNDKNRGSIDVMAVEKLEVEDTKKLEEAIRRIYQNLGHPGMLGRGVMMGL